MFTDVLNTSGDHPDIVVNGKPQQIIQELHGEFWETYCNKVELNEKLDVKQVSIEAVMLVVRFDTKISIERLDVIVKIIQEYLKRTFVFDRLSDNDARCIVTRSDNTTSIYFPSCRLIARYIETIHMSHISALLDEKVIPYSARTPVSLYGSTPEKYLVAYDEIGEEDEQYYIDISNFDHLHYTKIEQEVIRDSDLVQKPEAFWLPMILSIDYWRSITRQGSSTSDVPKDNPVQRYDINKMMSSNPVVDSPLNLDYYLHFADMWNPNRIIDVMYWKVIGQAFCTLEKGDTRGLNGWVGIIMSALGSPTIKSMGPNFFSGENVRKKCADAYEKFTVGEVDIRSLAWYARIDNKEQYEQWHNEWVNEALLGSISGTECDVGRVFYRRCWLDYMATTNESRTTFYRYCNHRLVRDLTGISLRVAMSNDFRLLYNEFKNGVLEAQKFTPIHQLVYDNILVSIDKIIQSLGKPMYKRGLLIELSERFNTESFNSYVDANPDITLVKNGVICICETHPHIYFRDGKPQDYLVKSFDAAYREDYHWSHPKVQEIIEWSFITFIDPDTIAYHWKVCASLLRGGNNDKKIVFWSGATGNNMKTTWQRYIANILGNKCISMPINYFTVGKGAANGATPAEIRLEGCRLMFSEEPENKVPLLVCIVKSEVGNDKRQVRALYGESKDIIPQHKCIIVCNDPPPIGKEGATVERVVIVPFETQATYDAPDDRAEQIKLRKFKRNPFFDRELPGLVDAGLWIMFNTYPIYAKEGLRNQPKEVTRVTNHYWDSIDKYSIFIKEFVTMDPLESIDGYDMYSAFDQWHQKTYRKIDTPDKQTAMLEFTKRLAHPINMGVWYGYKLKKR